MKFLRILFSIAALFAFVCVLAAVALVIFIDPNKIKPMLSEQVLHETGYKVNIDGALSWSFYPRLGVKAEHVVVIAPGQTATFAEMSGVTFAADLSKLIHGSEKLEGDVYVKNLHTMQLNFEDVHLGFQRESNGWTLEPLTASLYSGTAKGVLHVEDLSGLPRWNWHLSLDHIQMGHLLRDLNGGDSKLKIDGLGEVDMQAATEGLGREQMLNHLNGQVEFGLKDGRVEGVDMNFLAASANALINKMPLPMPTTSTETKFDSLTGTAIIKNGIASIDNLVLLSSEFKVRGRGDINLMAQTIDYHLQVAPVRNLDIKWEVPVIVAGSITSPDVKLDSLRLQGIIASEQLDKVKVKVDKQIKKLPEKANKLIQHLLGK